MEQPPQIPEEASNRSKKEYPVDLQFIDMLRNADLFHEVLEILQDRKKQPPPTNTVKKEIG